LLSGNFISLFFNDTVILCLPLDQDGLTLHPNINCQNILNAHELYTLSQTAAVNQPIDFELYKGNNESSRDDFEKCKREWKAKVEIEIYIKHARTRFIGEKLEEDPISQLQMITQVTVKNGKAICHSVEEHLDEFESLLEWFKVKTSFLLMWWTRPTTLYAG
jgi:hypothetical protein